MDQVASVASAGCFVEAENQKKFRQHWPLAKGRLLLEGIEQCDPTIFLLRQTASDNCLFLTAYPLKGYSLLFDTQTVIFFAVCHKKVSIHSLVLVDANISFLIHCPSH